MGFFDLFSKKEKKETLNNGLQNTKTSVFSKIAHAVAGKSKVDDDVLDDLEDVLITSDVGVNTTLDVIRNIEARVARDKYVGTSELNRILKEEIIALLAADGNTKDNEGFELPEGRRPYVILVVGVNGVGKTTTIAKIGLPIQGRRQESDSGSRRHLPRGRHRATRHLGPTHRSSRGQTENGS